MKTHHIILFDKKYGGKGKDWYILFPDKDTKDAYIAEESKHCAKAWIAYQSAYTLEKRKEKRIELEKARAAHATHKGYGPSRKHKHIWIYHPKVARSTA